MMSLAVIVTIPIGIIFIFLQILLVLFIIIGWIILWIWWSEETFEDDPEKKPIGIPQ